MSDPILSLFQKQSLFTALVADLIRYAHSLGYQVTFGECYRSPEEALRLAKAGKGLRRSLHCDRLAIDLNLFRDGVYLTATEDHRALGEWWETRHELCRWGGHFNDGNHYSLTEGGRS